MRGVAEREAVEARGFVEVDHSGPGTTIVIGGDLSIDGCTGSSFNGCRALTTATLPDNTLIGGSVKCNNSGNGNECVTDRCVIAGNLDCSGNSGGCVVPQTTVGGNVTLNNNAGPGASVTDGAIGGNVTMTNNSSGTVTGDFIGGNLKCNGNGGSTLQSNNVVAGTTSCN